MQKLNQEELDYLRHISDENNITLDDIYWIYRLNPLELEISTGTWMGRVHKLYALFNWIPAEPRMFAVLRYGTYGLDEAEKDMIRQLVKDIHAESAIENLQFLRYTNDGTTIVMLLYNTYCISIINMLTIHNEDTFSALFNNISYPVKDLIGD